MSVRSGRARLAELAFQVVQKPIHPEWFSVHAHRRFAKGDWEADVRIIDGGHAVIFRSGSIRLTEVLAAPEALPTASGLLFQSPIRRERSTAMRPSGLMDYQVCFEVERVDPEIFRHLCEEMTVDAARDRVFHRFEPSNRLAPAPLSHLRVDPLPRGLSIQTFHSFPDELAIVRSQSLYELPVSRPQR